MLRQISFLLKSLTGQNFCSILYNNNGVGVKPNAILDAVRNPIKPVIFDDVRKTFRYVGKGAVVILNQQRQIVTTWARSSLFWRIM